MDEQSNNKSGQPTQAGSTQVELTHVDESGRARMVDVSGKRSQRRTAKAVGRIQLTAETVDLIRQDGMAKGDVLGVARLAGIQAAKETQRLIPLCHTLLLDHVDVRAELQPDGVLVDSEVVCIGRTGVEMEAITAVSIALVTIYDMCKAVDKQMVIGDIRLTEKIKEDINV